MDLSFPLLQLFLDGGPNGIGKLSHNRTLFSRELTHLLQDSGELTFFAQQLNPKLFQSGRCGCFLQGSHCLGANAFQLLFHVLSS